MLRREENLGSIATEEAVVELAGRAGNDARLVIDQPGGSQPRRLVWKKLVDGRYMLVSASFPNESI